MIRITADTLEEAYTKASQELNHSVVDLDIEVLQTASKGFLGLFKKPAIISATIQGAKNSIEKSSSPIFIEIEKGIQTLLENSCFKIALTELKVEEELVYIKLDGEDAALMIGKEGYRYKALSYILHNWIKIKYNKNISLEIAEFLKNQDTMIEEYLTAIKERVQEVGKAQTKPLDGILVKLALEKLRAAYPEKYVAIRTIRDGRKIVIINEYRKDS